MCVFNKTQVYVWMPYPLCVSDSLTRPIICDGQHSGIVKPSAYRTRSRHRRGCVAVLTFKTPLIPVPTSNPEGMAIHLRVQNLLRGLCTKYF